MNAKRLYELLDGKLSLKDCEKLSPYCNEPYYGWPIKGIILDGQYADLIGNANVEYMKKQDYSDMLIFREVYAGWNVRLNESKVNPSYIDSLVDDIYKMVEVYPILDDDIYYRMEDELREEAVIDFLNRKYNETTDEIEELAREFAISEGYVELDYFYFSEEEALIYIENHLRDSKKTA